MQAAKRRLMEHADPAVKKLTEIAYDANNPVETRLKATLAIIDRSVGGAKTELEISAKPVDQIVDQITAMEGGSRAEFRRSQGIADQSDQTPKALPPSDIETVDAEIVDVFHTCAPMRSRPTNQQPAAIKGATVCKFHGGAARHVRNAARARLANAADHMAKELLGMATNPNVSDAVKLAAIRDALDRAGLKPGVEVEISTKPIDQICDGLTGINGGSREAFRRGIPSETDSQPPTPALAVSTEPVDAETAPLSDQRDDPDTDPWPDAVDWPTRRTAPGTDDLDESLNPFAVFGPPTDQMMTRADAYAAQADYRRRVMYPFSAYSTVVQRFTI